MIWMAHVLLWSGWNILLFHLIASEVQAPLEEQTLTPANDVTMQCVFRTMVVEEVVWTVNSVEITSDSPMFRISTLPYNINGMQRVSEMRISYTTLEEVRQTFTRDCHVEGRQISCSARVRCFGRFGGLVLAESETNVNVGFSKWAITYPKNVAL